MDLVRKGILYQQKGQTEALALPSSMKHQVGLPREVLTDQGINFLSKLLQQVYQLIGIKGIKTTPYHTQPNSLVETFNQTLKSMLRKFASQTGADWDQRLPYLLSPTESLMNETLLRIQVMIYAIEEINNSSLLPNVTLGYEIYDSCQDVSFALRSTLKLMEKTDDELIGCADEKDNITSTKNIKAVIGEWLSEISIAVARLLALNLTPQISYGATSQILSRKEKFPSFLRTTPSDLIQARAITELVTSMNWKAVGIFGSEDEYGKYGSEQLNDDFKNHDVCVEFKIVLPADFEKNNATLSTVLDKIQNSYTEAIVIFTIEQNVRRIFEGAIERGINKTWIASDAWSTSKYVCKMPNIQKVGRVIGVTIKRNKVPGFDEYLGHLASKENFNSTFLYEYLTNYSMCVGLSSQNPNGCLTSGSVKNCVDAQCLQNMYKQDESYEPHSIYLAVKVIAQALKNLLKCNNETCENTNTFQAWELLEEIKQVNLSVTNDSYLTFNKNGDPTVGYEIFDWEIKEKGVNFLVTPPGNCSKSCSPGYELKSNIGTCCKTCKHCEEGQYSDGTMECKSCSGHEYSNDNKTGCVNKTIEYLEWSDPFSIILVLFDSVGIVLTLMVLILFAVYRTTPIVKATGKYICFVALLALLGCFCSVMLFPGLPSNVSCMAGLPLFAISFTICVSCVLANLLQIFAGFAFKLNFGNWIKRLNKPAAVVMACSSVQIVLCTLWLTLYPPQQRRNNGHVHEILSECDVVSVGFFIGTLAYIAFLAALCFLFAFKGKQLPDLYKNASFITISMLIYLVVWMIFIPVYVNMSGEYKRAIEATAILMSSYSLLACYFGPKCYIILWKSQLNEENAIVEYVRQHYNNKRVSTVTS
ncbi:G-protein coupled receptor family C group 6 member A-like [Chanos chanos]|uniref:G-protein coupled receptor family C group 6 member A-like n=1 Tax=Chanos chanos TaxID=29144 RepID=A0A6J2WG44_CHACN|nr:G-protein coupled receptor family C group 6 member A-like [Chanos chanos]